MNEEQRPNDGAGSSSFTGPGGMYEPPINWADHEDIALKLYERFGDDYGEQKIYRLRFTDLLEWVLQIPGFEGTRAQSTEGHLEMIQSAWVYEWRDNQ